MARRRRSRGTWFPNLGTQVGDTTSQLQGRSFAATVNEDGDILTIITPLTFDEPDEGDELEVGANLSDIIGAEYVLQRIVGKFFIHRGSNLSFASPGLVQDFEPAVIVTAGIFVARANDAESGGGAGTPIGSASEVERRNNYSPLHNDATREPWLFRRTWILGSAGSNRHASPTVPGGTTVRVIETNDANRVYPASTSLYGSVADGPHIDSRVKRRISQDNRLFLSVSHATFPGASTTNPGDLFITGYFDYRIYGSLRKPKQSSAF